MGGVARLHPLTPYPLHPFPLPMPSPPSIHLILAPQGAEYRAVCRGLRRVVDPKPRVMAIPIGPQAVAQYLEQLQQNGETFGHGGILLMGLGGSLSTHLTVGDVVLSQTCINVAEASAPERYECDRTLTNWLNQRLTGKPVLGTGVTCDRVISSAAEKHQLGHTYSADIVDMEGAKVLEALEQKPAAVAILRVISDDCRHNLPDITSAISPEGSLQMFPLTISFLRRPVAAVRLIQGSLRGLQVLQGVTTELFSG